MHKDNAFVTLTYSDENLKSNKLQYKDFQVFVKALRSHIYEDYLKKTFPKIDSQTERRRLFREIPEERRKEILRSLQVSIFCTGEYGDRKKRPHWHALVFNWRPSDAVKKYTSDRGDEVFKSATLTRLWPHGAAEFGSLTIHSASYCARYAAKKLSHGKDGTHEFEPVSRRSCRNAIGKKWIEKNWEFVVAHGFVNVRKGDGSVVRSSVPRYYEKWLQKHKPSEWKKYVTEIKPKITSAAAEKEEKISKEEKIEDLRRAALYGLSMVPGRKQKESEKIILEDKFKKLQERQKL